MDKKQLINNAASILLAGLILFVVILFTLNLQKTAYNNFITECNEKYGIDNYTFEETVPTGYIDVALICVPHNRTYNNKSMLS